MSGGSTQGSQKNQLSSYDQVRLLSKAAKAGGEPGLRLVAQLIGAAPCPVCDYIKSHCKCN